MTKLFLAHPLSRNELSHFPFKKVFFSRFIHAANWGRLYILRDVTRVERGFQTILIPPANFRIPGGLADRQSPDYSRGTRVYSNQSTRPPVGLHVYFLIFDPATRTDWRRWFAPLLGTLKGTDSRDGFLF